MTRGNETVCPECGVDDYYHSEDCIIGSEYDQAVIEYLVSKSWYYHVFANGLYTIHEVDQAADAANLAYDLLYDLEN